MVTIRGGYRMARGWHYTKLSLLSALLLSFSGMYFVLLFLSFCQLFLSFWRFCFVLLCFCFHALVWSSVDVPLIFSCPADHVPDWQPRVLLGMVETRSVNVKNTTTTTQAESGAYLRDSSRVLRRRPFIYCEQSAGRPGSSEVSMYSSDTLGREFDPGKQVFSLKK